MSKLILIVDDDVLLRRSLAFHLQQAGYQTQTASNAEDAVAYARVTPPDLVLLDIGLPGMDGLDAIQILRDELGLAVIFLTARRRELDEVLGLELGADDYITKPFDLDILLARIKAVLRRTKSENPQPPQVVEAGDLVIDIGKHTVMLKGKELALSPREFDLLLVLARRAGTLVTTDELLAQVWGAEYAGQPQVVYVHIRWLREKIEDDPQNPQRLITVRGLGYRYNPKV